MHLLGNDVPASGTAAGGRLVAKWRRWRALVDTIVSMASDTPTPAISFR